MKKDTLLKKLHKPVHPVISNSVLIGAVLLAFALLFIVHAGYTTSSNVQPKITYSPQTATLTPMPIDTSTWKTYTDWKYGYSVKLPPEFYSNIPGKGATGDTIDPEGNGFAQFDDDTLSGNYPNRIAKYGFSFRIEKGNFLGKTCTTDQACFKSFNYPDDIPTDGVGHFLLHAKILNRDIKGLATVGATGTGTNGRDIGIEYEYIFTVNKQPFSIVVTFYYPISFQQTQTKALVINAILSSLTFPNQ